MREIDAAIVGGGPAGLGAAIALKEKGIDRVVLFEREDWLGGVLNQCIHDGFGLERYGENYSGPEYAAFDVEKVQELGVEVHRRATVLTVDSAAGKREAQGGLLLSVAEPEGEENYLCRAVVVATGCRERTRGAIEIPGSRPAGIYTAGAAQSFLNLHNLMPGKKIVILGSGDIGLIMARRLTLEGAEVVCVVEKEKAPGGLQRNMVQCLEDFGIPLYLDATIENVCGSGRLTGVDIVQNVEGWEGHHHRAPRRWHCECDTLITSVGLIPENEIVRTDAPGIFVIGNARYVHDLVDQVSKEGLEAADEVAAFIMEGKGAGGQAVKSREAGIGETDSFALERLDEARRRKAAELAEKKRTALEQRQSPDGKEGCGADYLTGSAAGGGPAEITCVLCPNGCRIQLSGPEITGAKCDKGRQYAREELVEKRRVLTTSVKVEGGELPLVSVRTDGRIPKRLFERAMEEVRYMRAEAPVRRGQVMCEDLAGTGVRLVATKDIPCNFLK